MRTFTVAELNQMPLGTLFDHSRYGRGEIIDWKGEKCMRFASATMRIVAFNVDGYPWDLPMELVPIK